MNTRVAWERLAAAASRETPKDGAATRQRLVASTLSRALGMMKMLFAKFN